MVDVIQRCLTQMNRVLSLNVDHQPFRDAKDPQRVHKVSSHHHSAIVEAIERRDGAAARRAMERHLDENAQVLVDAIVAGLVPGVTT